MTIQEFIKQMPKVELHVHLEGSIQPETLLMLAKRNGISLPADSVEGIHEWYQFRDFAHFIEVYLAICSCIKTADDMELVATEFIKGRVRENIRYSEVIFTPYTHRLKIPMDDQLAAINRARKFGEETLGIRISMMPDISREMRPVEESHQIADWAVANRNNGIISLGLGGPEIGNPPEVFTSTFERVRAAGFPATPHAGETCGPESIWGALRSLHAIRIGHGVRCIEDPALVAYLREKQIPLEVCPSSNVCLKVVPSLAEHPLPKLLSEGLFVTINSDDPPMFSTNLTEEFLRIIKQFGFDAAQLKQFQFNAIKASLLTDKEKFELTQEFVEEFKCLERELL